MGSISGIKEQKIAVKQLNLNDKIYQGIFTQIPKNVDLPEIKKYYPIQSNPQTSRFDVLPTTANTPLISKYIVAKGIVYLQSVPLDNDFTNLGSKAVYAPVVYNMAVMKNYAPPLYYIIGKDNQIELKPEQIKGNTQISIVGGKSEFIPESRTIGNTLLLNINQNLEYDGIYQIKENNGQTGNSIAFNFDRKESNLDFLSANELEKRYNLPNFKILDQKKSNLSAQVKHIKDGVILWKWCIISALICLLAEILLIRFLK